MLGSGSAESLTRDSRSNPLKERWQFRSQRCCVVHLDRYIRWLPMIILRSIAQQRNSVSGRRDEHVIRAIADERSGMPDHPAWLDEPAARVVRMRGAGDSRNGEHFVQSFLGKQRRVQQRAIPELHIGWSRYAVAGGVHLIAVVLRAAILRIPR